MSCVVDVTDGRGGGCKLVRGSADGRLHFSAWAPVAAPDLRLGLRIVSSHAQKATPHGASLSLIIGGSVVSAKFIPQQLGELAPRIARAIRELPRHHDRCDPITDDGLIAALEQIRGLHRRAGRTPMAAAMAALAPIADVIRALGLRAELRVRGGVVPL